MEVSLSPNDNQNEVLNTFCKEYLFLLLGNLFKYVLFCFILLFTSSSPCRKDQFAVLYFFTSNSNIRVPVMVTCDGHWVLA